LIGLENAKVGKDMELMKCEVEELTNQLTEETGRGGGIRKIGAGK